MKTKHHTRQRSGFSLLEVIIFLGILGVLLGVVLPSALAGDDFKAAKDRRNAQELVSICACAQVAGLNFVIGGDLDATIRNIRIGGAPAEGSFKGRKFFVSGMNEEDAAAASHYLEIENGSLTLLAAKKI